MINEFNKDFEEMKSFVKEKIESCDGYDKFMYYTGLYNGIEISRALVNEDDEPKLYQITIKEGGD